MKKLMNILVLSCQKATLLIEKSAVAPLSVVERLQMNIHVRICTKCAKYREQSLLLEKLLKQTPAKHNNVQDVQLSQKTKEQIQKQIDDDLKKN